MMIPFDGTWVVFMATMTLVAFGLHVVLRGRPVRTQKTVLTGLAVLNCGCSTAFTFDLIANPDVYFPFKQNLPFQFCTLMTFLAGPAIWFDWRPLRLLVYFPGVLGGFLALFSPAEIYQGSPTISLATLFFVVHAMNVILPVLLGSLGMLRPTLRDVPWALVWFATLSMAVLGLVLALRAWFEPKSNYFYFFDPEGAGILVALHDWIGQPVLYELPLLPIALGSFYAQYGLFKLGRVIARRARPR